MIHHVAIGSKRPSVLGEFYERLPGLEKIRENKNKDGSIRSIWFRSGGSILMLESDSESKGPKALIFSASSLNPATSDSLPEFIQETEYTKYFKDPDGNLLGYSSYPEPWPF
ncbi:VOC family protein [Leptospira ellisii]|uniref:Glyoxalase n=1 Tax=Leptospira ellisii TaxID=2023197 RepID=A0A2N0BD49_9LEPT|nr:glyoxalase [Leptospira ellisii]MDV6236045.1 VOC family protein [Leptospira ellisii]PJZ94486.1 glyoxalase [Leptospira ellisii]PKA03604.1 glyoxalase [Leptospira ellisii]